MSHDGELFVCEQCKIVFRRTGQSHRFCSDACRQLNRDQDDLRAYNAWKQKESRARRASASHGEEQ